VEAGAYSSVSLLRALKREFGFYCIELIMEGPVELEQLKMVLVMGGVDDRGGILSSMEQYNTASGAWSTKAAMGTGRSDFGACARWGGLCHWQI
jgi:hypothetical protein